LLFNSLTFIIFFLVVYLTYINLRHKAQNLFLLFASYFFYGWWDWRFLSLIFISTFVDYHCGIRIHRSNNSSHRKIWLVISVCTNLGILCFFKYFNFFADNVVFLLKQIGLHADPLTLNVILPVGISFYTFQTMSYTIDIYKEELTPTKDFLNFALFVSYFPQLVAGPIERAKKLLPQIEVPRNITLTHIREGSWLILLGYFKKVVIADNFAIISNTVFGSPDQFSGPMLLLGVYAFALQIYCDFSGYSDIARGISKLMGIELMVNFRMPYFAANPREFWNRWHISLSTWLRDYLYIPLGGNKFGKFNTFRNLFITMSLGGLWHGAAWHFIAWGLYHGILLIAHRILDPVLNWLFPINHRWRSFHHFIKILFMFHFVCIGWIFFRINNIGDFFTILNNIVIIKPISKQLVASSLLLIFPLFLLHVFKEKNQNLMYIKSLHPVIRLATYSLVYFLILLCGVVDNYEFIYFQF
jgi:alginate O-acetyltransferase complex protein AlgI